MRKAVAWGLVLLLALTMGVVACGGSDETTTTAAPTSTATGGEDTTTTPAGETADTTSAYAEGTWGVSPQHFLPGNKQYRHCGGDVAGPRSRKAPNGAVKFGVPARSVADRGK
jgi:hypothetical protein